jgi:DNA-binding CsgD family transcriptional regulator
MNDILEQTALLDALTDKQREVIALVSEGLTSKEIARKIGISESAVNQRIEVTRQRLGGMSRARIARLYRKTSTLVITIPTSNSLTGKSIQLLTGTEAAQQSAPEGAVEFAAPAAEGNGVLQPSTFLFASQGRVHPLARIGMIVGIAIGMLTVAVLVLSIANTLSQMFPRWQ